MASPSHHHKHQHQHPSTPVARDEMVLRASTYVAADMVDDPAAPSVVEEQASTALLNGAERIKLADEKFKQLKTSLGDLAGIIPQTVAHDSSSTGPAVHTADSDEATPHMPLALAQRPLGEILTSLEHGETAVQLFLDDMPSSRQTADTYATLEASLERVIASAQAKIIEVQQQRQYFEYIETYKTNCHLYLSAIGAITQQLQTVLSRELASIYPSIQTLTDIGSVRTNLATCFPTADALVLPPPPSSTGTTSSTEVHPETGGKGLSSHYGRKSLPSGTFLRTNADDHSATSASPTPVHSQTAGKAPRSPVFARPPAGKGLPASQGASTNTHTTTVTAVDTGTSSGMRPPAGKCQVIRKRPRQEDEEESPVDVEQVDADRENSDDEPLEKSLAAVSTPCTLPTPFRKRSRSAFVSSPSSPSPSSPLVPSPSPSVATSSTPAFVPDEESFSHYESGDEFA